jgi:hypothetical protein
MLLRAGLFVESLMDVDLGMRWWQSYNSLYG